MLVSSARGGSVGRSRPCRKARPFSFLSQPNGVACSGFTIVELVTVILIAGIVLAMIVPRFSSTTVFDRETTGDRMLSIARIAQGSAFGRSGVTINLSYSSTGYVFSTSGLSKNPSLQIDQAGLVLAAGNVSSIGTNPCTAITANSPFSVTFNEQAEIDQNYGVQICLNGAETLCISPAGFAHAGACL